VWQRAQVCLVAARVIGRELKRVCKDGQWIGNEMDERHADWVRDVAWAPSTGMVSTMIASCSEDGSVVIWTNMNGDWSSTRLRDQPFEAPVWRVSWSVTGNLLAVSTGDHKVTLWKQALDGAWEQVSEVQDAQAPLS
jgi:protein transport protein SEC13